MKRFGLLLILVTLFALGCGSGATDFTEQLEDEEPIAATTAPENEEPAVDVTDSPSSSADDPTQARERDWKLGDLVDPAVTVIEYGDFQ